MNYRYDLEKTIAFIEDHISENLTLEKIASVIGYSPFHFSRIFYGAYQLTVMEYVRRRRLQLAIYHLAKGSKIIDVAITFGFSTASGFSKAFRRTYGMTPTAYLATTMQEQRAILQQAEGISREILDKQVRFESKDSFKIIGFASQPVNLSGASTSEYAAAWSKVEHDEPEAYLYQQLDPQKHGEVGIFMPDSAGEGHYVLGLLVDDFSKAESNMTCIEIPAADYAVFTTIPVDESVNPGQFAEMIKRTWKGIFENWLEASGYLYDFSKLDFEYYDERCHSDLDAIMEIWIPVVKSAISEQQNF